LLRRKSFSTNARNRKGGKHDFGARPARLLTANGSILHIYGVRDGDATGQVKNRNQNRPASARRKRKPSQKSKSGNSNQASHQGAGRPWEKMDREEQYMKLIHMRRETMEARNETKLMRTKIARLENKAKKQDEQVETTLSKAAAAITAALSRNHDGMSPTGSSDVNRSLSSL
jgi:flagellum-specific peptidoglycan hydrolase FlgJ